jgi:hypothetical protein
MGFFITEKSRELESLLHRKFHLNRYKREWFKLTPENVREARHFASEFIGKPYIYVAPEDNRESFDQDTPLQLNEQDGNLPF